MQRYPRSPAHRRSYLPVLAVALVAIVHPSARAADADESSKLLTATRGLAEEVAEFVGAEKEAKDSIAIGNFVGPPGTSAGSEIVLLLKEQLKDDLKIVDLGSTYSVSGRYMGSKRGSEFVIVIEAEIKDALFTTVQSLRRKIVTDPSEGMRLLGLTVALGKSEPSQAKPQAGPDQVSQRSDPSDAKPQASAASQAAAQVGQTEKIVQSITKPSAHVEGTVVKAAVDSPYGIELLIQSPGGYQPCAIEEETLERGFAKVNIEPEQVYAVKIHNDSGKPVGVDLAIDGINIFAFSDREDWKKLRKMYVQPGKTLIRGWHYSGDLSHEFLITNYGDSAAARLGATEGIGVITASFFGVVPIAEGSRSVGQGPPSAATGFGKKTQQVYNTVPARFGSVLGSVSVRYVRPAHPDDLPPGEAG